MACDLVVQHGRLAASTRCARSWRKSPVDSTLSLTMKICVLLTIVLWLPLTCFGQITQAQCEAGGDTWDTVAAFGGYCARGSEQNCASAGGLWTRGGMAHTLSCILPAKDGGKSCTDRSQCQYGCNYWGQPVGPDVPVAGVCEFSNRPLGCYAPVVDGKVGFRICQ